MTMSELTRREALTLSAAALAVAALPAVPSLAAPQPILAPAWTVGTPGEYNWQAIFAETEDAARRAWVEDYAGFTCCENGKESEECDCEFCHHFHGDLEVNRVPKWDGKSKIEAADWFAAGMGHVCSRCGEETSAEDDGHPVGKEAVCHDCMTLADWDIVDPERAAELRAEDAEA
jgi:hypothetical protein